MTKNKMSLPGIGRREEKADTKLKRKDYGKKEETGDFASNDPYKTEIKLRQQNVIAFT
jgi:hypothetical protein